MCERSIIHLNVADFAVAVERVVDSRLRGRPVIIVPQGAVRAVVYDMSEEAYKSGVRKKMPLTRALRYCPDAAVLPPNPHRYERAMAQFIKHLLPYSPLVEIADYNGHLFLDATGTGKLFGPTPDVAWRIRKAVRTDMGFDPIWSVASNKMVAKVATRIVKPTGEYIVGAGDEAAFLKPLPLSLIPGIEHDDLKRFFEFNITCAGHVANLLLEQLEVLFGPRSLSLYDVVRGIDQSPVFPVGQKRPVVCFDYEFGNDTNDVTKVENTLYCLVEQAGHNLRKLQLAAKRVKVVIDYSDGGRTDRQTRVKLPTANDCHLFAAAKTALKHAWKRRVRIRYLRLICDHLTCPPPVQMDLFTEYKKEKKISDSLIATLDAVRLRFGFNAVRIGRTLAT